jgi:DnaJ-like protein
MPVLLAALLIAAVGLAGWLVFTLDPKRLARGLRYVVIGVLGLLGLLLAARGLAALDLPIGGLIVYLLHHWSSRGFPGVDRVKDWLAGAPHQAGASTVETGWLRMTLDQASGALDGEVLAGRFSGARLDQLGLEQLRALLAECDASDAPSARLLETYLDRTHPGWREQARESGRRQRTSRGSSGAPMDRDEALQVLGLEPGATPEQISEAHRRLMTKLHPDHGGTDYLASKINTARDTLRTSDRSAA